MDQFFRIFGQTIIISKNNRVLVIFVLNIIHTDVLPVSGNPKPRKSATELFSSDSYNLQMTRKLCRLLLASVSGGVPVL